MVAYLNKTFAIWFSLAFIVLLKTALANPLSSTVGRNLIRGSILKVAADSFGGLPFEVWKSSVVLERIQTAEKYKNRKEHPSVGKSDIEVLKCVLNERGWKGLWSGWPARTVEGCFSGAVLLAAKETLKKTMLQSPVIRDNISASTIAFIAGAGGGASQAIIMAPCSLLVSAAVANKDENVLTSVRKVWSKYGLKGIYRGGTAVAARQATNWASRQGFTELVRPLIKIPGVPGEIVSGCIGGTLSCWNTPLEIARIESQSQSFLQRESTSNEKMNRNLFQTLGHIVESHGVTGLYTGILPRIGQSCYQTVFLVCIPRILGS